MHQIGSKVTAGYLDRTTLAAAIRAAMSIVKPPLTSRSEGGAGGSHANSPQDGSMLAALQRNLKHLTVQLVQSKNESLEARLMLFETQKQLQNLQATSEAQEVRIAQLLTDAAAAQAHFKSLITFSTVNDTSESIDDVTAAVSTTGLNGTSAAGFEVAPSPPTEPPSTRESIRRSIFRRGTTAGTPPIEQHPEEQQRVEELDTLCKVRSFKT